MSKANKFFTSVVDSALQGHDQKPMDTMTDAELREFTVITNEMQVEMAVVSSVDAKMSIMRSHVLFITCFTTVSLLLGVEGSRVAFFGCLLTLLHFLWREFILHEAVRQANITLAKFNAFMNVKKNQEQKESE